MKHSKLPDALGVIILRVQQASAYWVDWKQQKVTYLGLRPLGQSHAWLDSLVAKGLWAIILDTTEYTLSVDRCPGALSLKDRWDWKRHKRRLLRSETVMHHFSQKEKDVFWRVGVKSTLLTRFVAEFYARHGRKIFNIYLAIAEFLPFFEEIVRSSPGSDHQRLIMLLTRSGRMYHVVYEEGEATVTRVFEETTSGNLSQEIILHEAEHTLRHVLQRDPHHNDVHIPSLMIMAPSHLVLQTLSYDFPYPVQTISFQDIAKGWNAEHENYHFTALFLHWMVHHGRFFSLPLRGLSSSWRIPEPLSKRSFEWAAPALSAFGIVSSFLLGADAVRRYMECSALRQQQQEVQENFIQKKKQLYKNKAEDMVYISPLPVLEKLFERRGNWYVRRIVWKAQQHTSALRLDFDAKLSQGYIEELHKLFPRWKIEVKQRRSFFSNTGTHEKTVVYLRESPSQSETASSEIP